MTRRPLARTFKTKAFARQARKLGLRDADLCRAIGELARGQGDDLGGNVWKNRVDHNRARAIVVTKACERWVFAFLFSKASQSNIGCDELKGFRRMAAQVGAWTDAEIAVLVGIGEWKEICHDREEAS
jgi:hypothetical protein